MSSLKVWRTSKKINQIRLAERAGTTAPTICRIERGDLWPGPDLLAAIEKATRGAVTAADIMADYQAKRRKTQTQAAE